ncbi:MAG: hypothetical protein WAV78_26265, partial [Xanthobacteraceae bacterium]
SEGNTNGNANEAEPQATFATEFPETDGPPNSLGTVGKTRIRCFTAAFASSGHACRIGFDGFVPKAVISTP